MLKRNLLILLVITVVALTSAMVWLSQAPEAPALPEAVPANGGAAAIGGSFALTDKNGKTVNDADFRGHFMLVFFGFTNCPDICPTTMATFAEVLNILGPRADQIVPILISVDPERDTPTRLKEYGEAFDPRIVMLTGSREQIDEVLKAYKVYSTRAEIQSTHEQSAHAQHGGDKNNYMVDHTALVYLMDRQGKNIHYFLQHDQSPEHIASVVGKALDDAR